MKQFIPKLDPLYIFDENLANVIEKSIDFNQKAYIYGLHGSGKSTHIEQICAKRQLPFLRLNLDVNVSRTELIGRDVICLENGLQVLKFQEGLIPFAAKNGLVLVLDEFDSASPEAMFCLQMLLEKNSRLIIFETGEIFEPHKDFRIFATGNTIGSGDDSGLYVGTKNLNAAQLDRFDIIFHATYISQQNEELLLKNRFPLLCNIIKEYDIYKAIVNFANLTRSSFENGDISAICSTRTAISFCQCLEIFEDVKIALELSFLNRLHRSELDFANELKNRCFA